MNESTFITVAVALEDIAHALRQELKESEAPVQAQPMQAQPMQAQPMQTQPMQTQPMQAQPTQAQPTQAQPMQTQPAPALVQSVPAPPVQPAQVAEGLTLTVLQMRLGQLAQQLDEGAKQRLAQLIHGYGVSRMSDMPAEHYADLLAKAEALSNG